MFEPKVEEEEQEQDQPSQQEIEGAIKQLSCNKCRGSDNISAELIKNRGETLWVAIYKLI